MAPLSTLGHWQREFEAWTDLNAIVYHGSKDARAIMRKYEWDTFRGQVRSRAAGGASRHAGATV